MLEKSSNFSTPPEVHFILGPGITSAPTLSAKITGDGKNQIDLRKLNIAKDSRVIINAHGQCSNGKHELQLHSSLGHPSGIDYTHYNFQALSIASKGEAVNVELVSCHGGLAIYDIAYLPKQSTLMTFVDDKYTMLATVGTKLMEESTKFIQPENQFTRFASSMLINADDNRFALCGSNNNHIFTSKIETLKDFSIEGIKTWQKEQIKEFFKFLDKNKEDMSEDNIEPLAKLQLC
jgi:hypothetical protein